MLKLIDIEGIGPEELELLEAAGWTDARAVATAKVADLSAELEKANRILKITAVTPDRATVADWIRRAAELLGEEIVESEADEESEVPAEGARENATGPLGFTPGRGPAAALERAAFALPIPARMLASQGISPTEVPVATLLEETLEEQPAAETVQKPLPGGREGKPRVVEASVKVSEPAAASGVVKGIDTSKVRTLEEAQSEPRVKAPSSKAVVDERIALIRTPLPETNAGRKPGSRFYIRGVLHDRPLKVWFGGLFAVLTQLLLPVALVSAPMLILSQHHPDRFGWVPGWIIAFPIALPVTGLLYLLVSTGAKCRVCGQRVYVPKHCLKNRKAHHLPYLGHIGALALHVMTFKWFTCTFCGTAIRIKK